MRKIRTIVNVYVKAETTANDRRASLWNDLRDLPEERREEINAEIKAGLKAEGIPLKRFNEDWNLAVSMGPIVDESESESNRPFTPQMYSAVNALGGDVEAFDMVCASDETAEEISKAANESGGSETPLQTAKRLAADLATVLPKLTDKQAAKILASLTA